MIEDKERERSEFERRNRLLLIRPEALNPLHNAIRWQPIETTPAKICHMRVFAIRIERPHLSKLGNVVILLYRKRNEATREAASPRTLDHHAVLSPSSTRV